MSKMLADHIELEDEFGESSFFRVDMELVINGQRYAVLTHVDDEGQDLAEESMLFTMEMDDELEEVAFEPVEDETLIERVEAYIEKLESQ